MWSDLVHDTKREVADGILGSEIRRLARLVDDVPLALDALGELVACFPVYRSYLPEGADHLRAALADACRRRPDLADALALLGERASEVDTEFSRRLQQTTGAVMAKGVEDCAFYRYPRLTSLTEVGGDPSVFAVSAEEFHHAQRHRLGDWPHGMTTLSTHDTKRGEDVRARISVLSEIPDRWADLVTSWMDRLRFPDGPLAATCCSRPRSAPGRHRTGASSRVRREGDARGRRRRTRWIDPDETYESARARGGRRVLRRPTGDRARSWPRWPTTSGRTAGRTRWAPS